MELRLEFKLLLAAVSGWLVSIVVSSDVDEEQIGHLTAILYHYGLTGALFSTAVLWPYLKRSDLLSLRAAALIVAGGISFWCALWSLEWIPGGNWGLRDVDYVLASVVGAAIVIVAAKYLIPFPWSTRLVLINLLTSVIGGIAFPRLMDVVRGNNFTPSFVVWHSLVCAALHFGTRSTRSNQHA